MVRHPDADAASPIVPDAEDTRARARRGMRRDARWRPRATHWAPFHRYRFVRRRATARRSESCDHRCRLCRRDEEVPDGDRRASEPSCPTPCSDRPVFAGPGVRIRLRRRRGSGPLSWVVAKMYPQPILLAWRGHSGVTNDDDEIDAMWMASVNTGMVVSARRENEEDDIPGVSHDSMVGELLFDVEILNTGTATSNLWKCARRSSRSPRPRFTRRLSPSRSNVDSRTHRRPRRRR